jgi:hypothetical protein
MRQEEEEEEEEGRRGVWRGGGRRRRRRRSAAFSLHLPAGRICARGAMHVLISTHGFASRRRRRKW